MDFSIDRLDFLKFVVFVIKGNFFLFFVILCEVFCFLIYKYKNGLFVELNSFIILFGIN